MNKTNPSSSRFWDLLVLLGFIMLLFIAYWLMQGYIWAFNRGL